MDCFINEEQFYITEDELTRTGPVVMDSNGNVYGTAKETLVITKEEFIACYKKWILGWEG